MTAEYLSYNEAMKYLGFKTQESLRNYIAQGLPVIVVGNSKKIRKSAIDQFMHEHETVKK